MSSFNHEFGNLFPYFVCRISGLPSNCLETLRVHKTVSLLEKYDILEKQLYSNKQAIVISLHEEIGKVQDQKARNLLLKLKRAIFDLKLLPKDKLVFILEQFSSLSQAIHKLYQNLEEYKKLESEIKIAYNDEIVEIRRQFKCLLEDKDFLKGLLISSQSLFSSMPKYISGSDKKPATKEDQIERGLLRFFSRMVMKTTPFGTFCSLAPGKFYYADNSEFDNSKIIFQENPRTKQTFLRLNKRLYDILLTYLKKHQVIRNKFNIRLNPTLRVRNGLFIFLASIHNREVFQHLQKNTVLSNILNTFKYKQSLPLCQLIDNLCNSEIIDSNRPEAETYLNKLLDIGFLRFRIGIPEQEVNWDRQLRMILEKIDNVHAQKTCKFLMFLRKTIDEYATASLEKRASLLASMKDSLRNFLTEFKIADNFELDPIFYEDTAIDTFLQVSTTSLKQTVRHLVEFTQYVLRISWSRIEQATMRHFWNSYYEQSNQSIPLLQFYEDYYREHFKSHLEKEQKSRLGNDDDELKNYNIVNPFDLEVIDKIQDSYKQLAELIKKRCADFPDADEISIEPEDLEEIMHAIPKPSNLCGSVSIFAHIIPKPTKNKSTALFVQNGAHFSGFGKYFSRFLYMFPDTIRNKLYEANELLSKSLIAEICGDAKFNANLHPPLLRWEINYPTGESGQTSEQIPTSALFVEPDPDNQNALCLRHGPTGKRVIPVDLGFLSQRMRPPLFQLLSRFTTPSSISLQFLTYPEQNIKDTPEKREISRIERTNTASQDNAVREPKITYRPRITYRCNIILSRKHWQVPIDLFPEKLSNEKQQAYFIRVNKWRKANDIPKEVFVRIFASAIRQLKQPDDNQKQQIQQDTKEAPEKKVNRKHLYKPQYIDFDNPLLVNLFGRLTIGLQRGNVILEERLPGAEDLTKYNDERYATELILQFNYFDGQISDIEKVQAKRKEKEFAI